MSATLTSYISVLTSPVCAPTKNNSRVVCIKYRCKRGGGDTCSSGRSPACRALAAGAGPDVRDWPPMPKGGRPAADGPMPAGLGGACAWLWAGPKDCALGPWPRARLRGGKRRSDSCKTARFAQQSMHQLPGELSATRAKAAMKAKNRRMAPVAQILPALADLL